MFGKLGGGGTGYTPGGRKINYITFKYGAFRGGSVLFFMKFGE